jgi:hypothetical protein
LKDLDTTTYIKELINIPERVHQGDFVLKLSEGVKAAEATLADYVVTPELARCFDDALNFIQSAVTTRSIARPLICTAVSALARVISWRC